MFNLMMVYVANNGSNDLFVTTSANGTKWTTTTPITGQSSLESVDLVLSH